MSERISMRSVWTFARRAAAGLALGAAALIVSAASVDAQASSKRGWVQFEPPTLDRIRRKPAELDARFKAWAAARFKTRARNAVIWELPADGGAPKVLFDKGGERAIPPASMTKIMTAYVAFRAIAAGEISGDDTIRVSKRAAARRGSTMALRAGVRVTLDQLLAGLIIASGNDAATAIAEAISGREALFARRMTETAQKIGMSSAAFRNASGLPRKGHRVSVQDLALLAARIQAEFPERMPLFARTSIRWGGLRQWNRNPALSLDLSRYGAEADGMKTGHTNAAGYCVVATATQTRKGAPPRRFIVVLAGLRSEAQRARETDRALKWALERG